VIDKLQAALETMVCLDADLTRALSRCAMFIAETTCLGVEGYVRLLGLAGFLWRMGEPFAVILNKMNNSAGVIAATLKHTGTDARLCLGHLITLN